MIHVSGHPAREDLKKMYSWIKPKILIPVHGEQRHMAEHINFKYGSQWIYGDYSFNFKKWPDKK